MTKKQHNHIIQQVPVDYYQLGVKNNLFQKMWHLNKLKNVPPYIPISSQKILDVGCASGWFISQISKRFSKTKCFGLDIYDKAIVYAKERYPHIEFKIADAHRIPYKRETFDVVVCTEVLEHVDDPEVVFLEIKRVLKKRGRVIVELDSGSLLFSMVWYLWRKFNGKVWNDSHVHSFNVRKLEQLSKKCGFLVVEKKRFNLGMAMVFVLTKR